MKIRPFALPANALLAYPALAHVGHAVLIAPEEVEAAGSAADPSGASDGREWLAGDHLKLVLKRWTLSGMGAAPTVGRDSGGADHRDDRSNVGLHDLAS